jgi:tetratricopeptide (TPR) repeat protein
LVGLVRIARGAYRNRDTRLVVPAMMAYGHYLEDEGHYPEAQDVLETLLRITVDKLSLADHTAALLRLARVNRKMANFTTAESQYDAAGEMARSAGDVYSSLLGRLGNANCLWGRGNLAEAERRLRAILADARSGHQRDAEARAEHGLGVVLGTRSLGQPHLAVAHLWRAFERYEDEPSQTRVLGDLAFSLMTLGQYAAAERALQLVVKRGGGTSETLVNALIELMHCASARHDRIGFERWRNECDTRIDLMPPHALTDYYYKAGIGLARFGNYRGAHGILETAYETASRYGFHEHQFLVERMRRGLEECEVMCAEDHPQDEVVDHQTVREVAASLAGLVD